MICSLSFLPAGADFRRQSAVLAYFDGMQAGVAARCDEYGPAGAVAE